MSAIPRSYACLCQDSSLILAEILENQDAKTRLGILTKYQKQLQLDTYLAPTVASECTLRMNAITDFIANLIRDFENYFRLIKKLKPIVFSDTVYVREFFRTQLEKYKSKTESENELLRRIEALVVSYMWEKLGMNGSTEYIDLVTGIMAEITKFRNLLHDRFNSMVSKTHPITSAIDPKLLDKLKNDANLKYIAEKKPSDLHIICEVEAHQRSSHKWTILVTLDVKHFLKHSNEIDNLANVKCIDPLYIPEVVHNLGSASRP